MTNYDFALRLLMALLYGSIIGIERQWHHKNAGLKTNALVSIGATVFALVSAHAFGVNNNNPAQVAAGVVTGVGFIGGGVIMRRGGSVQGINTAATLWAAASMGVVIAVGYYFLATLVFVVILFIQFALRWAGMLIDRRSGSITPLVLYKISLVFEPSAAAKIHSIWADFATQSGVLTHNYSEAPESGNAVSLDAGFGLSDVRAREMVALSHRFAETPGVLKAAWSQTSLPDND
jgi:putative Mg2+ transporter-C (MgtC) family protein